MGSENLSNGSSTAADRGAFGVGPYRQGRRDNPLGVDPVDGELAQRPSAATLEPPSLALEGLPEPVYSPQAWLEAGGAVPSMADHPLLRGLLLELPPRGNVPPAGWLDRWFEAARSILELLYQENNRPR